MASGWSLKNIWTIIKFKWKHCLRMSRMCRSLSLHREALALCFQLVSKGGDLCSLCRLSSHILCLITHWTFPTPTLWPPCWLLWVGSGQEGREDALEPSVCNPLAGEWPEMLRWEKRNWLYFYFCFFSSLLEIWREVSNWQHAWMQKSDAIWV
jgi:hypothetical protein